MPDFTPVNVQESQNKAITGNLAALPKLEELASRINSFTSDELLKQLNKLYPGYSEMLKKQQDVIGSGLRGELPADVVRNVKQYAAEAGTGRGTNVGMGSSFDSSDVLRKLGLTSLERIDQSLNASMRWTAAAQARAPQFDFSNMFVTPQFQFAAETSERNAGFQRDWVQNQLDAKYSLGTIAGQAMIKTDDQIMGIIASLAGSYGGSLLGGGGGGGAYGGGSSWG